ncbi:peritrophin-1-like [Penaeus indicus]|uniref:peritrophin-1-like n=1 Tax=Penaeus indicus TaxID=29960 RepID=UPI00300C46F8
MALLVISLLLMVSPSKQVCAPNCTGVDPGAEVRDPRDFTKYYICLDTDESGILSASVESVLCPPGKYFNDTRHKCELISTNPSISLTRTCDPCQVDCPAPFVVTPHPTICSLYYVCLADGHTLQQQCFRGYYFNYHTGLCTEDESQCYNYCDPYEPHCTYVNQKIPHPLDNTKFYLCTLDGPVRFQCPGNMPFQEDSLLCDSYLVDGHNAAWKYGTSDKHLFSFLVIFFVCLSLVK